MNTYNRTRNHAIPHTFPELLGKIILAAGIIILIWVFLSVAEIAFTDPLTVKNNGVENTYSTWNIFRAWITNR